MSNFTTSLVCILAFACSADRDGGPDGGGEAGEPDARTGDDAGDGDATPGPGPGVTALETLTDDGGRLDWLPGSDRIAYDRREAGCYEVHVMDTAGAPGCADPPDCTTSCVSCVTTGLPTNNVGQPAWHPGGRYLVVQAEKQTHPGLPCGIGANPGAGVYNDLWSIDTETRSAIRIVELPTDPARAILHPHLSADGAQLSWTEMIEGPSATDGEEFGIWELKVADVAIEAGQLALSNIRTFTPNGRRWYENHGFSPDGQRVIFTSSEADLPVNLNANIYTMTVATGAIADKLTTAAYNEHAIFSPDGEHVIWMSGADVFVATDWWVMDADGTDKRQLTRFSDPASEHYQGTSTVAADFSWGDDDGHIVGYAHSAGLFPFFERIYLLALEL